MEKTEEINVRLIDAGVNDRGQFEGIEALAESIGEAGLQNPIIVRPKVDGSWSILSGQPGRYEIVAGERRFRAVSLLKWKTIGSIVRSLNDEEAAAVMLLENAARRDLNPIEQAKAFQVRMERFGWDEQRVAQVAGVSSLTVRKRLSLTSLIPEVARLLASGNIPLGHAEAMTDLDVNRQLYAVRLLTTGKGVRLSEFRRYVADLLAEQKQSSMWDLTSLWVEQVPVKDGPKRKLSFPVAEDLPAPEVRNDMTTGEAIELYMAKLRKEGFKREASVIARLYKELVEGRRIKWSGGVSPRSGR